MDIVSVAGVITSNSLVRGLTYGSADVERLGDPTVDDGTALEEDAVDVLGAVTTLVVNVTGEVGLATRATNEENSLDCSTFSGSKLGHGVNDERSTLGVTLQDEALGWGLVKSGSDVLD